MAKKENSKEKNKNNFLKDLKAELKKVTWPTLKKLVNNTFAVISIVIILAMIVFVLNVCFENLNKFWIERLKSLVSSSTQSEEDPNSENETEENDDFEGIKLTPQENNEGTDLEGQTNDNSEEVTQQ